jgi:RNA polymerase sigma-70 factor (ECF subfamily)
VAGRRPPQATFLKAWQSFAGFVGGTNCRAWLLRILRNTWLDQVRKKAPVQLEPESLSLIAAADRPDPPAGPEAIQHHLDQFADERVAAAVLALPEDFRLALFLVDVEGYSHEEAAGIMGVAGGTAKSRASRARELVRQRLVKTDAL